MNNEYENKLDKFNKIKTFSMPDFPHLKILSKSFFNDLFLESYVNPSMYSILYGDINGLRKLNNQVGFNIHVTVDVSNYKDKKVKRIEREVKRIMREVEKTKIEAKLDPMNSYERRIVHNAIGKIKGVATKSEGDEPNRCVVIRKEEE